MITAGIAMLAGILLACYLPREIDATWLSFLPATFYLAYINPRWRIFWLVICGFLWVSLHIHWQLDQRLTDELNNKRVQLLGEVINIPQRRKNSARLLLKPIQAEGYDGELPQRVRLYWRDAPVYLEPGQIWSLKVKLKKPHGFHNPGGFDYQRWLFVKGIGATGYVVNKPKPKLVGHADFSLHRLRARINGHLERLCQKCGTAGLIQALAIGYRGELTDTQRVLLQQTGTAHLIAISGLHIGIIAGWFYLIGKLIWRRFFYRFGLNRREFALSLSWTAALIYAVLSGLDLPAQRAMLMLSVVFLGLWIRLPINLLHGIFSALFLILLISPLAVLSESFWLSFSALGVIALGSVLIRRGTSNFKALILIQILFSLLFIPVSIVIFGQLQVASFLANIVAVPLVSIFVVPIIFMLQLLFWLPVELLVGLFAVMDDVLGYLLTYLQWLQGTGLAAIKISPVPLWKLFLLSLFMAMLVLPKGVLWPRMWLILLPMVVLWPGKTNTAKLRMSVLDVGMGTSIVVQTRHHSLVYDFGPGNREGYSLGKWVVQPFLQYHGIRHVDRVIISHADQDHLGGFYALHQQLQFGGLISGTPVDVSKRLSSRQPIHNCHRHQPWSWDGVEFEFLSADVQQDESDNNRSCVLRINTGEQVILVAGDIEASQEHRLLRHERGKLKADVLIAPHHGSLTSSSESFVQAVQPSQVIFTVGYLNRWLFPREEVLRRYLNTDAHVYRTDRDGAILINCENSHCQLQRYRRVKQRLWY